MLRKDTAQDQTPDPAYLREWSWEKKAAVNPLYAVMSIPDFAQSSAMPSEAELRRFWADGARRVARDVLPWLQQVNGFEEMRVLEFGRGMGRLLAALAGKSKSLAGVDVSPSMIGQARQHLPPSVELRVLEEGGRIPFPDAEFEFVYSYAVFQHISRRSALWRAIAEIGRVLKPGGRAKLQFTMVYPPDFATGHGAGGDSYALRTYQSSGAVASDFPLFSCAGTDTMSGTGLGRGTGNCAGP